MTKRHHVCDDECKSKEENDADKIEVMKRIHQVQKYHWEINLRNKE